MGKQRIIYQTERENVRGNYEAMSNEAAVKEKCVCVCLCERERKRKREIVNTERK